MKILVFATGGTIGSSCADKVIDLSDDTKKLRVLEQYNERYGDCHFDVCRPLNILSENLELKDWEILVNTIRHTDTKGYDGLIVTHGSDTLSYTSAMLGLCLCDLPLPLVITASNYVPDEPKSNALINIRCAVKVMECFSRGIFSVFCDSNNHAVYLPTRLCEAERCLDCFSSFERQCFADFQNDRLILNTGDYMPSKADMEKEHQSPLHGDLSLKKRVLMLHPYPGMDYRTISIGNDVGAVLHILYHSATAKSDGDNSILTLAEQCSTKKIPLFCASFKDLQAARYASSVKFIQKGVIPLYALSDESAYAKLLLACNQNRVSCAEFMQKDIYFETV
ncbi:MAG: asparaginase domain-containing protein, partial [Acutalibacteraceae bacterium]